MQTCNHDPSPFCALVRMVRLSYSALEVHATSHASTRALAYPRVLTDLFDAYKLPRYIACSRKCGKSFRAIFSRAIFEEARRFCARGENGYFHALHSAHVGNRRLTSRSDAPTTMAVVLSSAPRSHRHAAASASSLHDLIIEHCKLVYTVFAFGTWDLDIRAMPISSKNAIVHV